MIAPPPRWGATPVADGTVFRVHAPDADAVWLCLFGGETERRVAMDRDGMGWSLTMPGVTIGQLYGYRAHGPAARHFDAAKLLVDPYATEVDRRFVFDPRLAIHGVDTAALVPKARVTAPLTRAPAPPLFRPGGLIYEVNVRGFTMRHPDVPAAMRGTLGALAHPAVLAHLARIGVAAVEVMPIVAWIDERHLPPLGLRNGWGYNPVVPMALDPGLVPGGMRELVDTIAALRAAGIGLILDLVLNHSGESDAAGPTLALRGLDEAGYYTHDADGALVNDAGTGNILDFAAPVVRDLALDTMRHFARAGVDGFRFDLAPVMARGPGFDPAAPIFAAIAADPILADRVMIAEPWDVGPGGYRLGQFPATWLEWNDRYRDDVRRFWRGDGDAGTLATRIAGSADLFGEGDTRSINFVAAHDGFTLADCVAYGRRHNLANGEDNRDGHGGEISWNHGAEGASEDAAILARRRADIRAMLATLFASRGTPMLCAGDEFGRSQLGNNNAYAQDNPLTWLDWTERDQDLEAFVSALARWRRACPLASTAPLASAEWRSLADAPMTPDAWTDAQGFILSIPWRGGIACLRYDRAQRRVTLMQGDVLASLP